MENGRTRKALVSRCQGKVNRNHRRDEEEVRALPSLSYELKLKCKFTDYECLDGMVELEGHQSTKRVFLSHGWGGRWSDIKNCDILIGDDIERIRLSRNDMAHSKKFSLDDNKYYDLCGILERVLHRLEVHNGKGKLYTDQMKDVKKKETKLQDWQTYQKKITYEFPRLKMKPSFEVKVGGGCTLECETVVPLPDGSKVYWVKEKNSKEVELRVDETTSNKYKGSQVDYPSLNIFCATKEDEGHYSCRIRYPEESAESMDENITWPKTCLHVNNCKYYGILVPK
ncbi:TTN [Mytilus edulis]|uniref:TTN n=1 Tax=Mytilus edulis TaxID=6550 RepID=A0A8S3U8B9_MYTED|nr:TTN [Mytilus edulis]